MTEADRALALFKKALDMESKGREFYEKAVAACDNPVGKEIFTMLMNDEVTHQKRIRMIYESLQAEKGWAEDWKSIPVSTPDMLSFFKGLAEKHGKDIKADTSDLQAMDVGIDFEKRAVDFYEEQLKTATDPNEIEFVKKMILEEKDHRDTLNDMKLYYEDPEAWFMEKEGGSLDGA